MSFRQRVGTSVQTTTADGAVAIAYEVHENGRGPACDATLRLAADGTLATFAARGHREMGQPLEERFAVEGTRARWKSLEESGERELRGPAFYLPGADCPEPLGLLAERLARSGAAVDLLPDGEARAERAGELTVRSGAESRHLTGYAITGLDLEPRVVWLDDDGRWFGIFEPEDSVVPEGWEGAVEAVLARQRELGRERDAALARRLARHAPAAGVAYVHARVLDVEAGAWLPDRTVIVVGGVIRALGPSASLRPPAAAEIVDLGGKALLPGLWDMHSHLSAFDGPMDIASGVTTARDVGNSAERLDDFKARFDAGAAIGPRVLRAGFIEGRGPDAASSDVTAMTPAEARDAVALFARRGYEQIKIYNSVPPALVPILTREAHARGMTVTGHVPWHMLAPDVVRAGYDGIEHVNMLFLSFFADHETDTRTTLRFSLVADRAASLDLGSKPVRELLALLRDHHTVVDPTFVAFEDLFVARPGAVVADEQSLVARLPPQARRAYLQGGLPMEGKQELYARSWERVLAMAAALRDAGVTVVAGTDALAGLMLHHELELFVRGGLSPLDALRDATIVPARAMKLDRRTGSIAPGKDADLCVVDGDPLASISDIARVVETMRAGVRYGSAELYATAGVAPWK